jgi:RNase P subunit RPR2
VLLWGRQYCRKCSVRILPSRDAIYRTVKQAEERGIMCDKCAQGRGASVRTEGAVGTACEAIIKSPTKSVRRLT